MSSDLEAYLIPDETETGAHAGFRGRMGSLARLSARIARQRAAVLAGLAMIALGTFATLLEPRIFGYAIDEAIVPRRWDRLRDLGVVFLLVVCVRVGATIAQGYLFELIGQRVTQELRVQLFAHLQRLPVSVFDRHPAGRLLTRVTNDIASLNEMFSGGFVTMLSNSLLVLGILVWLLALDFRLGLIASAVFPALVAVSVVYTRMLRGAYRDSRSRLSALNAFLAENLGGMRVVQLFNRQKLHLERFDRINQWYADSLIATIRVYAYFQPTITIASGLAMALVIYYGGREALGGGLKLGVLTAFFSYVFALFQPVRDIADKWNVFLSGMISAERIFAILSWPTELPHASGEPVRPIEGLRGHVVFENVWFAYEEGSDRWALRDFSLDIPAGSRVGVVGHTGAGKTTLISLLLRFYEPQRGRILLDGKDLREYDKRGLRASIGIIQQDAFVFSGSLRDNVTFWGPDDTPGARAARQALEEMGYGDWWQQGQDRLNERGSNLSMGEKQVLAFARAIAAEPRIWILDEATANMDSGTEEKLRASLEGASRGRTSFLIAHRLATVRDADLILVLHQGTLQEAGRHEELMKGDGLYARLYRYQRAASP